MKNRLLPNHLFTISSTDEREISSFVSIFRKTWGKLPLTARRAILANWRGMGSALWAACVADGSIDTCRVELIERIEMAIANCDPANGRVKFALLHLRLMPSEVTECVIAHELAHSFIASSDRAEEFAEQTTRDYMLNAEAYADDPEENEVDRIVREWGFDPDRISRWQASPREAKD